MTIILLYHQIAEVPADKDPVGLALTPERFEQQMRYLHQAGYQCMSLGEAIQYLRIGQRLKKTVVLTFDDGFEDVYTTVWPILDRFGFTATIFPVAGCVGRRSDWQGQNGSLSVPLLSWQQARELTSYGFAFGSHTMTHPRLSALNPEQIIQEVQQSKQVLEDRLGIEIDLFSYPYSDHTPVIEKLVADSGYLAACSGERGIWGLFNLWRAQCGRNESQLSFQFKIRGWYHRMIWLREEFFLGPSLRRAVRPVKRLVRRSLRKSGAVN